MDQGYISATRSAIPTATPVTSGSSKALKALSIALTVCAVVSAAVVIAVFSVRGKSSTSSSSSTAESDARFSTVSAEQYDNDVQQVFWESIHLEDLSEDDTIVCWKNSYGRGVGKVPESCPEGEENDTGLCYPLCKDGYYGVGPVCWEHCPSGWIDEGALCREKGSAKTIAKKSYGRGVGKIPGCPEGHENDASLCYPFCKDSFYGVGPVCWGECPTINPIDGGALCCRNATVCTDKIKQLSSGLPLAIANAIIAGDDPVAIMEAVKEAIEAVLDFIMPLCGDIASMF